MIAALIFLLSPPAFGADKKPEPKKKAAFLKEAGLVKKNLPSAAPSLEEKIGQMIMVGFNGFGVSKSHPLASEIKDHHVGGVILYDRNPLTGKAMNIQSSSQVKALVNDLNALSSTPLFIAIDYEGGKISRLKKKYGFPKTLSHAALGKKNDPAFTYKNAAAMAGRLKDLGINMNMAPVVDLAVNPKNPVIANLGRSFSADPAGVTRHALPFIEAEQKEGILSVIKHFPGHGSSKTDSHKGMTDVTESWNSAELIPFRNIIAEGKADAVMTAHIFNKKIDPDYPATLSKPTITGILRYGMGFDGVVISDDMQMRAIADHFGLEKAVIKAIDAGVDILLFSRNATTSGKSIPGAVQTIVKKAVKEGRLSEARINESYRRIMALKARLSVKKTPQKKPVAGEPITSNGGQEKEEKTSEEKP